MIKYILFGLLLLIAACHNHTEENHEHDYQIGETHEEENIKTTLFSDSTEYFIEYNSLVKGEESEFLVHLTKLKNYKPYTSGKVTITLGNDEVTAGNILRPGIFKIVFKPKESGPFKIVYTLKTEIREESVADSVFVYTGYDEAHEHDDMEIPGVIGYTKEQVWKNKFMVNRVFPAPFESVISASGEMLAMPGEKQNVAAKSTGILLFASKKMVQGSVVKQGELLFTISGQDMTDDNIGIKYSEAKNKYLQSKSEYIRHLALYNDKIISEKQFIESKIKYQNDSSLYYSLSSSVSAGGQRIYAPITGYIHGLTVSEGQYVETGQLLATISTNKVMLLRADLPQQHFNSLQYIKTANFRPAYSTKTYRIEDLKGSIIAKGASVAENNHYMPVFFKVENNGNLLEGSFVEFYLITQKSNEVISVPNTALIEEQGRYYVYRQVGGEAYLKTPVEIGETDGLRSSVLSGLQSGDLVVTEGAMLIKLQPHPVQCPPIVTNIKKHSYVKQNN
ncbi:MAG: efflux RND transporter periplasmic adaptor subunit [Chloroflexia bacterium]|nr:efflux RND transporter periplasmic adaptor subunit [Chloroflexia bacterium]